MKKAEIQTFGNRAVGLFQAHGHENIANNRRRAAANKVQDIHMEKLEK